MDLTSRVSVGVLVAAVTVIAFGVPLAAITATPPAVVPEINGASLSAGLALLGAGALWLRARRRVK
jgi:MYXO-CTERM domain-containing protein